MSDPFQPATPSDARARRKRRLVLEVIGILAVLGVLAAVILSRGGAGAEFGSNPELARELLLMEQRDISARRALTKFPAAVGQEVSDDHLDAIKRVESVDKRHTDRLEEIIDEHGWPGRSLVGEDAASAAWLIVQHTADRKFQKRALKLMQEAGADEVDQSDLAYLIDRDRVFDERKQVYGTQFHCVDGAHQPYPIADAEDVDERRRKVGLHPLAEERKRELEVYGPCPTISPEERSPQPTASD
jgi:hypothetical protein